MSNVSSPFGFRPSRRLDGAEPNYQISVRQIASTNANKIGYGDPVKTGASGATYLQGYLDLATAGSQFSGIFIGCSYVDSVLGYVERPSWAAPSTAVAGSVLGKYIPDPMMVFECQVGNYTSAVTQANIGNNANFGGTGTPTTASGISVAYLDGATIATTNTLNFRIIGFSGAVNNDTTSANPIVEVIINSGDYNTTTGI